MSPRILILADDLSGAADCAVACHRAGMLSQVCLVPQAFAEPVDCVALDLDSRPRPPAEAWGLTLATRALIDGSVLYRKIDSTLRGHVALEIAATLEVAGSKSMAIVCPAYPVTGRTVVGGCVYVNGQPLAETEIWQRSGRGSTHLMTLMGEANLSPVLLTLDQVRGGDLKAALEAARASGARAVVCDAETEADLAAFVQAGLSLDKVVWVGSGGMTIPLAQALARVPPHAPVKVKRRAGPILAVVGSASSVSRAQLQVLAEDPRTHLIHVQPRVLFEGPAGSGWRSASRTLVAAVGKAGKDVIAVAIDPSAPIDPGIGPALTTGLGQLLGRQMSRFGALITTGGETARAILGEVGATALCIRQEIEPGVVLSTVGDLPVVTKAGAFGDAGSLTHAVEALRALPLA